MQVMAECFRHFKLTFHSITYNLFGELEIEPLSRKYPRERFVLLKEERRPEQQVRMNP